jgi:polyisoprenoid-binding protein YceI
MKSLKLISLFSALILLTACGSSAAIIEDPIQVEPVVMQDANYQLDTANSTINWIGRKVLGEHHGKVQIQSGSFTVTNGAITAGDFTIDMQSITDEDITDEGMNKKLVDHLKSDDFFSVEKFPTVSLIINGSNAENETILVQGDMTIKGITQPVEFPVVVTEVNGKLHAIGTVIFDRTKFDIKFRSGSFIENLGDKAIHDEVELRLDLMTL